MDAGDFIDSNKLLAVKSQLHRGIACRELHLLALAVQLLLVVVDYGPLQPIATRLDHSQVHIDDDELPIGPVEILAG